MNNQTATQFWFKPSCLRWHNLTTISNVHNLLHSYRMKCQCHLHFTTIYTTFQLTKSTETTHKIDTLVRA